MEKTHIELKSSSQNAFLEPMIKVDNEKNHGTKIHHKLEELCSNLIILKMQQHKSEIFKAHKDLCATQRTLLSSLQETRRETLAPVTSRHSRYSPYAKSLKEMANYTLFYKSPKIKREITTIPEENSLESSIERAMEERRNFLKKQGKIQDLINRIKDKKLALESRNRDLVQNKVPDITNQLSNIKI